MDLGRFWRHALMSPATAARSFSSPVLDSIQREIAAQEKRHSGQVVFVVEAELTTPQLWRDLGPRARAREVFAQQGVWNTEENSGVLIYLLLADRRVEIVADRGIDARVNAQAWESICATMQENFSAGRFEEGAIYGVRAVSDLLERHFPAREGAGNELSDRPIVI